jgi:choline monooxygenase
VEDVMGEWRFEPELARARTLPAAWYRDPALLAREEERVFARTWQMVGHEGALAKPGDYLTTRVAGEELVLTRDEEGTLRALSNVCRHRAGPVARGAGCRRTLQCAYHGWSYAADGRLLGTPEWEGVQDFDRASVRLPAFRVDTWNGFVFVNLDPGARPLAEWLGEIVPETHRLGLGRLGFYKRVDYEIACNWKVYVDNYLEGYHIPIVHPGLFAELDYNAYRVDLREFHSRQHAPIRSGREESLYRRNLEQGAQPEALYYWLFPNLMLNVYPDNLQTNVILPLGPERTVTRFEWFVPDPGRPGLDVEFEKSLAFSDAVQQEDVRICEDVQRGLQSRTYETGRFSVRRENGVHQFHGLLSHMLGEGLG